MHVLISSVLAVVLGTLSVYGQFEGDECTRKYDNSPGICTNVRSCPKVREEYNLGVPLTVCAYVSGQPVVCCPSSAIQQQTQTQSPQWAQPTTRRTSTQWNQPTNNQHNSGIRISAQKCSEYGELTKDKILVNPLSLGSSSSQHALSLSKCDATTPLIVGGEKTKNGEFPHMAAIGWRTLDGTLDFKCGGSLISDQFVLTAAHCSFADKSAPQIVRLGDQNLRTRNDNLIEVDVPIAEFIKHESYTKRKHYFDIALIKLSRRVSFTKNIRPACLWQTAEINSTKTVATGWGYTETAGQTSDDLMKVELDIVNNQRCNFFYEDYVDKLQNGIVDAQMCAGVLAGKKDTCNGDSGGPIQITTSNNPCLYHIIGITSFGSPFCGAKNSPGVYTRVSSYLDWIEDKVWT